MSDEPFVPAADRSVAPANLRAPLRFLPLSPPPKREGTELTATVARRGSPTERREGFVPAARDDGNPRGYLNIDKRRSSLSLFNERHNASIGMGVMKSMPSLLLIDEQNSVRASMSLAKARPRMSLFDKAGGLVWRAPR